MSSTMGGPKSHWKKAAKITLALFFTRFNTSKCKTAAKLAVARMKLLRNKREVVVRQMRRDIALLLQSGQDATARIRVSTFFAFWFDFSNIGLCCESRNLIVLRGGALEY
ncbi:IST1-like protein [Tanacetum coccineum]|uniref:IST1-like protein n=1 Tax=Tanacetum coccineum TaxID=301880 RepID=A0ABQ5H0Y8_9ASTR